MHNTYIIEYQHNLLQIAQLNIEYQHNLLQIAQLKLVLIIKNNIECEWDPIKLTFRHYAPAFLRFCKYWSWPIQAENCSQQYNNNKIRDSCVRRSTYFISF